MQGRKVVAKWLLFSLKFAEVIFISDYDNQGIKIVSYLTSIYKLENKDKGTPLETGKEEISPDNKLVDLESNIGIQFNQAVELGTSGTITMTSGSTHQVFDISKSFINGKISELFWIGGENNDILFLNPTKDFIKGTKYWVDFDAGVVKNKCNMTNDAHTGENSAFWITDPGPVSKNIPQNGKSFSSHGVDLNYDRKSTLNDNSTVTVMDQNNNVLATIPGNSPALSTKEG